MDGNVAVKSKGGIELTFDQAQAVEASVAFFKAKGSTLLTLGGFAGTGKTTCIAHAVKAFGSQRPALAFCAFTGRASSVLRAKLETAGVMEIGDYCGTIHGLIYEPVIKKGRIIRWKKVDSIEQEIIVVDEASMVNEKIYRDLASYGVPILAVGDHGQLPPVEGSFNLMQNPEIKLERIHRQAAGNPIIALSAAVRAGGRVDVGRHGEWVSKTNDRKVLDRVPDLSDALILCGFNSTRTRLNSYVRKRLGFSQAVPTTGEKVICLKNNHDVGIYNGTTGKIASIEPEGSHWFKMKVKTDDVEFDGKVLRHQFGEPKTLREYPGLEPKELGDLFDWGYAMTVHKAQGSEGRRVVLFEERFPNMDDEGWRRWLYTGITRAQERLLIIGD